MSLIDTYAAFIVSFLISSPPLTSTWPHLRCDVGLEEGNIEKIVSVLQ